MNMKIGQLVEIKTRHYSYLYKNEGWVEKIIKGQIVSNPKWLDEDYVSILTDNSLHPISMVFKQNIVGLESTKSSIDSRFFNVKSKKTGKQYKVVFIDGVVSCDCIG